MSATRENGGARSAKPQVLFPSAPPPPAGIEGPDALEALLAIASIREQAIARGRRPSGAPEITSGEYFALDEVLEFAAARAAAITGADGIAVGIASEDAIVCHASFGRIAPDPGVRLDPSSEFSGACLRHGLTVRCDDSQTDPRVDPEACRSLGARSMVAVPLKAKGRVVGLIEAFSSKPLGFKESAVSSLNLLGELLPGAIHPAEEERLAQLAGRILPAPSAPEPEQPAEAREPFRKEAASASREVEADTPDLPVAELATLEQAKADGSAPPPPQSSSFARETRAPAPDQAPAAGSFETSLETRPAGAPVFSLLEEEHSYSSLAWAAVWVVLAAAGLGSAWVGIRHAERLASANTNPSFLPGRRDPGQPDSRVQPAPKPGMTAEVTGIRHWASRDSSTVVIEVGDEVQYETHALENPPQIYFDLFDTKMAPGLPGQTIAVDDGFIKRVRMEKPSEGTTRVVLDTQGITEASVKLDSNPYRLTIDVHKPSSSSPAAKPSPAIAGSLKKASHGAPRPRAELRLALDAGHGGWDLGTVGNKGLLEKDLVLDIVDRLGRLVEDKLGAEVIYTRQDDSYLPLEKRAEIANLEQADLFLSVHANYSNLATARGVETYYSTTYSPTRARTVEDSVTLQDVRWAALDVREKATRSERFATDIQDALYAGLAARSPAIRNRGVKQARYVVLTGTRMPAILAEVSFVSSPADEDNLASSTYRQQIAEALYRGLARYHSQVRPAKLASAQTANSE